MRNKLSELELYLIKALYYQTFRLIRSSDLEAKLMHESKGKITDKKIDSFILDQIVIALESPICEEELCKSMKLVAEAMERICKKDEKSGRGFNKK